MNIEDEESNAPINPDATIVESILSQKQISEDERV